jgi:dTDP-4-amino-4,6-dideoxygalactose transaminase
MGSGVEFSLDEMITFVEHKQPDFANVQALLDNSLSSGHWANFGPAAKQFETTVYSMLGEPSDRAVVACASGTVALHCLVNAYGFKAGRPLRWIVSAFTFSCQVQGPLSGAIVVDCDSSGSLDIKAVRKICPSSYDGIIITNLFGASTETEDWVAIGREHGKHILFDSAAGFFSSPHVVTGDGEIYSFHHTKPCGFGEGGCIVVPLEIENTLRILLSNGAKGQCNDSPFCTNGKMSDVSAAFILDRLQYAEEIREQHVKQYMRVQRLSRSFGFTALANANPAFPSLIALIGPTLIPEQKFVNFAVSMQKYYRPLSNDATMAINIFEHIVCLPCHQGMTEISDETLEGIFSQLTCERQVASADNNKAGSVSC